MANEDQEKTEEASAKKIEDAKKDGNVPKSQDLSGFITLTIAMSILIFGLDFARNQIISLYLYYQNQIGQELTLKLVHQLAIMTFYKALLIILPLSVCVAIAGIFANLIQFGFIFTTKPLIPDLKKINPLKGLKNLFSLKKLIEGIKIVIKVATVFIVAFYFFLQFTKELPRAIFFSMNEQLIWLKEKMIILIAIMLLVFLVISLIDLLLVRFQYFKDLRMSKQELKDEYKQMEGDPQVKARIRRVQMEMGRKRMMSQVPQADVVITNPTHYAVALRYDKNKEDAPLVLAKGTDMLAIQIKKIALEHDIQIVENPPLAREIYKLCDIDDLIPSNLFAAVAEILSFVYMANKNKFKNKLGN